MSRRRALDFSLLVLSGVAALIFLSVFLSLGCAKKPAAGLPDGFATADPGEFSRATPAEQPAETAFPEVGDAGHAQSVTAVYFEFDGSDLQDDARATLRSNAEALRAQPARGVVIEGHCDERGSIEYNLALGQRRADTVRNYLAWLGIDASRMRTVSYGEEKPADAGHDEDAWAQNRRAEFDVQ